MLLILDYIIVFLECWDGEPDNRPTIYQVVDFNNYKSRCNNGKSSTIK
jgi:hypothetical protein